MTEGKKLSFLQCDFPPGNTVLSSNNLDHPMHPLFGRDKTKGIVKNGACKFC